MDYENNFENDFGNNSGNDTGNDIGNNFGNNTGNDTGNANTAEAKSSAAFSDWTQKLRFDRSFSAKLILSDPKIKEYYAAIATEILKYERIKTKTGWSGVSFSYGKNRFAFIAITGKTLCLYLASDPVGNAEGRYKAKNVGSIKKRAATPSLFKIRSDGAKRHALKLIDETALAAGLKIKTVPTPAVNPANFRTDTFNNLITRGLIRIVRNSQKTRGVGENNSDDTVRGGTPDGTPVGTPDLDFTFSPEKLGVYADTLKSTDDLISRHGIYNDILTSLSEGAGTVRVSEKLLLRSIDEIWVRAVEDCVNSLDELIRNPNRYIAETEEVLPIELTKRISGRSITHLSRHTDYIIPGDDGEIKPTKMLNVFREDSLLTYENKFLNTLLNRLYMFVTKRYKIAKEHGVDEKLQSMEFENEFTSGEGKGKIKISVEYSERNFDADVKNTLFSSGLWSRVERLNAIVTGYFNSSFVKSMDRNYVRPPIMRTNAILKNKYFRECLALWEFIESYEDAGYGITVNEIIKDASEDYVKQLYASAAMQYLVFKRNINEKSLDEENYSSEVRPEYYSVEKIRNESVYSEDFSDEEDRSFDDDVETALKVALIADEIMPDDMLSGRNLVRKYVRTFSARLRLSSEELKDRFAAVSNELLKFDRVKMRISRRFATFNRGRMIITRMNVVGKTLKIYLPFKYAEVDEKYRALDVSDKKRFVGTPVCLKIRSNRGARYAIELVNKYASENDFALAKKPRVIFAEDYPLESNEDLILKGFIIPVWRKSGAVSFGENPTERTFFGSAKNPSTEESAEIARKLAVSEAERSADEIGIDEAAITSSEARNVGRKEQIADSIDEMIRPDSDYSKPTKYGIDDTSGFMKDAEESRSEE